MRRFIPLHLLMSFFNDMHFFLIHIDVKKESKVRLQMETWIVFGSISKRSFYVPGGYSCARGRRTIKMSC